MLGLLPVRRCQLMAATICYELYIPGKFKNQAKFMLTILTVICELFLKIKELLEFLKQTGTCSTFHKQAVENVLVQAKQEAQTSNGLYGILAAVENIMIKIKDDNRIKEIIHDVQVIGSQVSNIFSEEIEVLTKIKGLIQEIEKLSQDL